MNKRRTSIDGLFVVETEASGDSRGSFSRFFCEAELKSVLGNRRIVQINHSRTSVPGSVRGLHFQRPPHAEMKFVRCLRGHVWDVALDIRAGSPTFGHWHAEELNPASALMMAIPEGFAHGFQTLTAESELLYLHTEFYTPALEDGIAFDDPRFQIEWPVPVAALSARDRAFSRVPASFFGILL